MNETTRTYARIALVALIIIGAGWVLAPFIAALLFAAILCLTTWPLFAWIEARVKGRTTLAALLATLILATAVLVPMAYLTATIADGMTQLIVLLRAWFEAGDWSPPAWLSAIPLAGEHLEAYWRKLAGSQTELANLGKQSFEPTRKLLTSRGGPDRPGPARTDAGRVHRLLFLSRWQQARHTSFPPGRKDRR